MVADPPETPPTIPLVRPAVAMLVVPEIQVPPVVVLDSVALVPAQNVLVPVMAAGEGLTVTTAVREQPVAAV